MKKKIISTILTLTVVSILITGCNEKESTKITEEIIKTESTEEVEKETSKEYTYDDLTKKQSIELLDYSKYVTLPEYTNILESEFEETYFEVTSDEIQEQVTMYLQYYAEQIKITDRAIVSQDPVSFNLFITDQEGIEITPLINTDYAMQVGIGTFGEEFDNEVIGKMPGETIEIESVFPEDFFLESYANQKVTIKATINHIIGTDILPEYTDDFVVEMTSGDFKTTKEFDAYIENSIKETKIAETSYQILNSIVENTTFKNIEELIDMEYQSQLDYYKRYAAKYEIDFTEFIISQMGYTDVETFELETKKTAEQVLKEKLIMYAIFEKENYEITDQQYIDYVDNYYIGYGYETINDVLSLESIETIRYYCLSSYMDNYLYELNK